MTLTPSDVSSLTSSMELWERFEYIFAALVTIGCFGEYVADFTKWWTKGGIWVRLGPLDGRKETLAKLSTLLLIGSLALELVCLVRTNQLSGEVLGSLNELSGEAFKNSTKALGDATTAVTQSGTAQTASAKAVGESSRALQEADSFEKDIASAKKQASEAEAHLSEAVLMAKAEETELLRLEKQVAPRVLSPEQQRSITMALRQFAGRTVIVATYGLDGEGAGVGTQIISVLRNAGLTVLDQRAQTIVTGGFDFGIHVRGPAIEQDVVSGIGNSLSSIGNLQVWLNASAARVGTILSGSAVIGGASTILGGGGPPGPIGPTAPGTPVIVMVGIKPVEIVLAR